MRTLILLAALFLWSCGLWAATSSPCTLDSLKTAAINPKQGYVAFWLKAPFDGADGKRHVLFAIGSSTNGFLLEKSQKGMLRLVSRSKEGDRVARSDISGWKKDEWHHIAFAWFSNKDGMPIGMPLYIDRTCVDGPVPGKAAFFAPEGQGPAQFAPGTEWQDLRFFKGDWSRWGNPADTYGLIGMNFQDFLRSAPVSEIRISPRSSLVETSPVAVEGNEKRFSLEGQLNGQWIPLTDEMLKYGNWSDFDAKPFIKFSTEDNEIAQVVKSNVIRGMKPGKTLLKAEYNGLKASYNLEVKPIGTPDLCVTYVSILPRYSCNAYKDKIAPGDTVTSIVHVANYGYKKSAPAKVTFALYANESLDFDPKAEKLFEKSVEVKALEGLEQTQAEFVWQWPEKAVWMESSINEDAAGDFCPLNNAIRDRNVSRPLRFGFPPEVLTNYYKARTANVLGSCSLYDWVSAHKYRLDRLLRDTKYPLICPDGITDTYRIDMMFQIYKEKGEDQPYYKNQDLTDGGFPIYAYDINGDSDCIGSINSAIVHELGHTCLALPDVYGYPTRTCNVLLKDKNGKFFAGTPALPDFDGSIFRSSAQNVPCGAAYSPLMDGCHMWINPANAGKIEYCKGLRGERFWGVQGRLMPIKETMVRILDQDDEPLKGAAVSIYHVVNTETAAFADKYFPDMPKFAGQTNGEGVYLLPERTLNTYDSPYTDRFDGDMVTWNPFGVTTDENNATKDTAFTPNVFTVEGILLVKIEATSGVEFAQLSQTDFNEEFYRGHRLRGVYTIRTNLKNKSSLNPAIPNVPKACRKRNLKPQAKIEGPTEILAQPGSSVTLDAGPSTDPEKQPLHYRWHDGGNWYANNLSTGRYLTVKAPDKIGEKKEIDLFVIDGVRSSKALKIKITADKK